MENRKDSAPWDQTCHTPDRRLLVSGEQRKSSKEVVTLSQTTSKLFGHLDTPKDVQPSALAPSIEGRVVGQTPQDFTLAGHS